MRHLDRNDVFVQVRVLFAKCTTELFRTHTNSNYCKAISYIPACIVPSYMYFGRITSSYYIDEVRLARLPCAANACPILSDRFVRRWSGMREFPSCSGTQIYVHFVTRNVEGNFAFFRGTRASRRAVLCRYTVRILTIFLI